MGTSYFAITDMGGPSATLVRSIPLPLKLGTRKTRTTRKTRKLAQLAQLAQTRTDRACTRGTRAWRPHICLPAMSTLHD